MSQRDQLRVELAAGCFINFQQGFQAGEGGAIGTWLQHGLVGIGQRYEPGTQRKAVSAQLIGALLPSNRL